MCLLLLMYFICKWRGTFLTSLLKALVVVAQLSTQKTQLSTDTSKVLSAPQCKNAVSAFQISCQLLSFTLEDTSTN